jgi:hypothetical protein
LEGYSRIYLARILRRMGELEAAEAEARRGAQLIERLGSIQSMARGTLAEVLLARGRPAEALVDAREAMAPVEALGKTDEGEALARLVYAEALHANGQEDAARAAIVEARDRLLARAARIDDPSRQRTFLDNVPENARTLLLCRQWLGEP